MAAEAGDTRTVEEWLDAGGDVNASENTGRTLLLAAVANSQVELCRTLLARGADPSLHRANETPLWLAAYEAYGGLQFGYYTGERARPAIDSPSINICQMLVESGADLNARELLDFGHYTMVQATLLARVLFFFRSGDSLMRLNLASMLLRAGAHLESIVEEVEDSDKTYSASWCLAQALLRHPELGQDEDFINAQNIVAGVAEAGSYKRWLRRPHRSVLRLRSLYARGRARLARAPHRRLRCYGAARQDHAIEFLVKLGDNGIVWNILSFWKETN